MLKNWTVSIYQNRGKHVLDFLKFNFSFLPFADHPNPIKTQSVRQSDPPFKGNEPNRSGSKSRDGDVHQLTDQFGQLGFQNKYGKGRGLYSYCVKYLTIQRRRPPPIHLNVIRVR